MSNALAIAAVTATLQALIGQGVRADPDLNDTSVTILPPDKARDSNNNANQINLFLYQIMPNAALRNSEIARQVAPGESALPPLALQLSYLITVYGRNNDSTQPFSHQLLGQTMRVLHDHPLLGAEDIKAATAGALPRSDLDRQLERVRITMQPFALDEICKLWTGFQTQYRLSVAYEVSAVLIESARAAKTPLPVLTRGPGDSGVSALANLSAPFPGLDTLTLPARQASARLGDLIEIGGHHLDGGALGVLFNHRLWSAPLEVAPEPGAGAGRVTVRVPNVPALWPAGFYTLAVLVQRPGETSRRSSNQLTFSLAPEISIAPQNASAGDITFTVACSPLVRPEQRVVLLLGERELLAQGFSGATNSLSFFASQVAAGSYWVRLRVDGVDTLLVNRAQTPPVFDPGQKVTIT